MQLLTIGLAGEPRLVPLMVMVPADADLVTDETVGVAMIDKEKYG